MCVEATKFPQLLKYTSIYEYKYRDDPPLVLWNTNKLLAWYEEVVDGLKTGWTEKRGIVLLPPAKRWVSSDQCCFRMSCSRSHFQEAIKLLNYGFARYTSC